MTSKILDIEDLTYKPLDQKLVSTDVKWMYKQMGLGMPKVYFADSYGAMKKQIKKYAKSKSVEILYNDNIRNKGLENGITEKQIQNLRDQYGKSDTNDKLDKVTEVLVKNTPEATSEQYFGGGFEMFYSLDTKTNKRIYDFYTKGVFAIEHFEKELFICANPVAMRFDSEGRLSGGEKPAIEFADGNHMFFFRDVFFTAEMWKKITSRKMPIDEILNLPNVEQRSVAIEFMGPESLLDHSDAKVIDGPTARGNTLYELKLKMGDANRWNNGGEYPYKLLRYGCPSTDRQYASFIPEEIDDADEAMAWKHRLTKEEYLNKLKVET